MAASLDSIAGLFVSRPESLHDCLFLRLLTYDSFRICAAVQTPRPGLGLEERKETEQTISLLI